MTTRCSLSLRGDTMNRSIDQLLSVVVDVLSELESDANDVTGSPCAAHYLPQVSDDGAMTA